MEPMDNLWVYQMKKITINMRTILIANIDIYGNRSIDCYSIYTGQNNK